MSDQSSTEPVDGTSVDAEQAPADSGFLQSASNEVGAEQVQEKIDAETAQGFRGVKADPTPNEHYTFPGQAAGLPTPETDDDQAAAAADHARRLSRGEVS